MHWINEYENCIPTALSEKYQTENGTSFLSKCFETDLCLQRKLASCHTYALRAMFARIEESR